MLANEKRDLKRVFSAPSGTHKRWPFVPTTRTTMSSNDLPVQELQQHQTHSSPGQNTLKLLAFTMFFPVARISLRAAAGVARRGYADVADGALKLSLVLPHQVSGPQDGMREGSYHMVVNSTGGDHSCPSCGSFRERFVGDVVSRILTTCIVCLPSSRLSSRPRVSLRCESILPKDARRPLQGMLIPPDLFGFYAIQ